MIRSVLWVPGLVVALIATACSGAVTPASNVAGGVPGEVPACVASVDLPGGAVANAPVLDREFPWLRVDPVVAEGFDDDAIISGGPPPDGIRPIDAPCFDAVAAVDWLAPTSPVLAVEVDGDRRAYPLAIMTQHEIVNDVVGGLPVVVTYCPLCNSGLVFERTVDGQVLDFGTSGRLYQSNLIMYDRQTRTLWTQFTGRAVVGSDFVGTELVRLPTALLSWAEFADATPDGLVLSPQSVPGRDYGRNPYPGYEGSGDAFLFEGPRDDQLPPNTRVVGLGTGTDPVAVPLDRLRADRVVVVELDGQPVSIWWAPGQASALDASSIDDGVDVGSTGAFLQDLEDGTTLTFLPDRNDERRFRDEQTDSTWNLFGEAIAGPLAGTRLVPVARDDTFWFVWFAFQPTTRIAS